MIFERGHFKSNRIQKGLINESLKEIRTFSFRNKYEYKPTVFISHKHSDLEDEKELEGIIELLEDLGAKIYIDSMDNKLPEQTTGETAVRIKEVIKHCKKFVLLATKKAIESYWCNWELGFGDTHKYKDNIAIFAIKEKGEYDDKYVGNEYLQIYPSIFYRENGFYNIWGTFFEKGYYVKQPNENIITPLKDWLKS
jgi:TIR domain